MNSYLKNNLKWAYVVNLIIFALVILMMGIYYVIGAKFLVFYSIFVGLVYILNFLLIKKLKLRLYVWCTYTMLTLYMAICTIMLGYNYGFNLYAMSTIPLIYFIKYIGIKINGEDPQPLFWTIAIILSSVLSSLYTVYHGPVYDIQGLPAYVFLGINMVTVCLFLFVFSRRMIVLVIDSEAKLEVQANYDALTGLSNRYFMRNILLEAVKDSSTKSWLAMIDIDKFKKINDTYGHNVGDEILKRLAMIMTQVCKNCTISRWGGEEFIIYGDLEQTPVEIIEKLRSAVEEYVVNLDGQEIKFTITCGVTIHEDGQPMDKWIISADNKLYSGKESGRNRVVY